MSRKRLKNVKMLKTVFEEECDDPFANIIAGKASIDENLHLEKGMPVKEKWKVTRKLVMKQKRRDAMMMIKAELNEKDLAEKYYGRWKQKVFGKSKKKKKKKKSKDKKKDAEKTAKGEKKEKSKKKKKKK